MKAIRQLTERRRISNTPDNGEAIPAAAPAETVNCPDRCIFSRRPMGEPAIDA
jgi:hypothetical protein